MNKYNRSLYEIIAESIKLTELDYPHNESVKDAFTTFKSHLIAMCINNNDFDIKEFIQNCKPDYKSGNIGRA